MKLILIFSSAMIILFSVAGIIASYEIERQELKGVILKQDTLLREQDTLIWEQQININSYKP